MACPAWRDNALFQAICELRTASARCGIEPTYFEALSVLAFIIFRDAKCDDAVLEVGMGGRLDATNVTRPLVALITPVAMDHQEFLGDTIEAIAREKAGVIHRGCGAMPSARDARVLVREGYRLERVVPVDLFPQTPHVETEARFRREGEGLRRSKPGPPPPRASG